MRTRSTNTGAAMMTTTTTNSSHAVPAGLCRFSSSTVLLRSVDRFTVGVLTTGTDAGSVSKTGARNSCSRSSSVPSAVEGPQRGVDDLDVGAVARQRRRPSRRRSVNRPPVVTSARPVREDEGGREVDERGVGPAVGDGVDARDGVVEQDRFVVGPHDVVEEVRLDGASLHRPPLLLGRLEVGQLLAGRRAPRRRRRCSTGTENARSSSRSSVIVIWASARSAPPRSPATRRSNGTSITSSSRSKRSASCLGDAVLEPAGEVADIAAVPEAGRRQRRGHRQPAGRRRLEPLPGDVLARPARRQRDNGQQGEPSHRATSWHGDPRSSGRLSVMIERRPTLSDWESSVERQIREGIERGEFDNLPGAGKPLEGLDGPHDEEWWVKQKLRREQVSGLPPALAVRKELEVALDTDRGGDLRRHGAPDRRGDQRAHRAT